MLNNNCINRRQLFMVMVLFQLGSSLVIPLAISAKQDAWIAILVSMLGGTLLSILFTYIYIKNEGRMSFEKIITKILGKYLGRIVVFGYIMFFIYIAARVVTDFRFLIGTTILYQSPTWILTILVITPMIYGCYRGLESFTRASEIFFIIVVLTLLFTYVFVFMGKLPELSNLKPVLGKGWGRVINAIFPVGISIPFGETVAFIEFYSKVNNNYKDAIRKPVILSNVVSGFILSITMVVNIMVISVPIVENATFPLLLTVSSIKIGNFFERLDILAIILLMIGGFYKILIFFYTSVEMLKDLSNLPAKRRSSIVIFLGIIIAVLSTFMTRNIVQHYYVGLELVPKYMHVTFLLMVPLILGIVTFIKANKTIMRAIKWLF